MPQKRHFQNGRCRFLSTFGKGDAAKRAPEGSKIPVYGLMHARMLERMPLMFVAQEGHWMKST